MRHQEGLSLVASLVGHPKETDDFTLNMVSLTTSHVKVEVNVLELLPDVVEFESENGEVVEVSVEYPWKPPTCSYCKGLGHISRNCLSLSPPAKVPPSKGNSSNSKTVPPSVVFSTAPSNNASTTSGFSSKKSQKTVTLLMCLLLG